jgi:hypothetical protein
MPVRRAIVGERFRVNSGKRIEAADEAGGDSQGRFHSFRTNQKGCICPDLRSDLTERILMNTDHPHFGRIDSGGPSPPHFPVFERHHMLSKVAATKPLRMPFLLQ